MKTIFFLLNAKLSLPFIFGGFENIERIFAHVPSLSLMFKLIQTAMVLNWTWMLTIAIGVKKKMYFCICFKNFRKLVLLLVFKNTYVVLNGNTCILRMKSPLFVLILSRYLHMYNMTWYYFNIWKILGLIWTLKKVFFTKCKDIYITLLWII